MPQESSEWASERTNEHCSLRLFARFCASLKIALRAQANDVVVVVVVDYDCSLVSHSTALLAALLTFCSLARYLSKRVTRVNEHWSQRERERETHTQRERERTTLGRLKSDIGGGWESAQLLLLKPHTHTQSSKKGKTRFQHTQRTHWQQQQQQVAKGNKSPLPVRSLARWLPFAFC